MLVRLICLMLMTAIVAGCAGNASKPPVNETPVKVAEEVATNPNTPEPIK